MRAPVFPSLLLLAVMLTCLAVPAMAQRLQATVEINTQQMPSENQNKLIGLDRVVETYIDQRNWAPNDYKYDVPFDIQIVFDEVLPVEFEDRYKAKIVLSNRSNLQYSDPRWQFSHEPGMNLMYSEQFESFRSLIDFYTYMVLGFEFDKVKKFGGQPYYEQAQRIAQMARLSSRYFLGWEQREEWVEEVIDSRNDYMRYLNFLYYTGEWLYYTERDRDTARQYILYAVKQIDKIRDDDDLKRFYDLNYYNFATALGEYEEWSALSKLASLDPNPSHAEFYERLLNQR